MGCSCKNKVNTKYAEDGETFVSNGFLPRVFKVVMQFLFGIVSGTVIIALMVPALFYLIVHLCIGSDMRVRIPDLTKMMKR